MKGKRRQAVESRKLWDEDLSQLQLEKSKKRAAVVITIFLFCFGVISFRLVDLMVFDHDRLVERATQQYIHEKVLKPQRGVIWDRRMREMAANVEADSLYAIPSEMEDTRYLSRKLAPLINDTTKSLNMTLLKKKKRDFIWLARKMDTKSAFEVRKLRNESGYRALRFAMESKRYYPMRQTASHLLGFTNIDNQGISGIELMYNKYLEGAVTSVSVSTDARGNRLTSDIKEAKSGNNILLTIDEGIQYIVERELAAAMEKWKARAAVGIVMNPMTGEILAMANNPAYDPNRAGEYRVEARRNRAITDLYEPGSTLKTVLAAAAIEEGVVGLNDKFDASKGFIAVGGKAIWDVHKNEIMTFKEVIQRSSNVGAVQIGLKLGTDNYYYYIRKFGFGEKTGIDFPGEVRGILRETDQWSGTSLAALSIGQEIGVTPLQVLRAYAVIANGGILVRPYIVSDIISPKGEVIKRVSPTMVKRVISRDTAETVTEILKTVVEQGGTARKANIKGNLVAGKTGTAQIYDHETGRYSRKKHVSSFVGFAPADNPELAVIVVIYEPKGNSFGGVVAAPVFKNIVEHTFAYMDVPMEMDENRIILVSKSR